MLKSMTLEHYFDTVWCIVESKFVSEYMIGYTRRPSRQRLSEYWGMHGYQYLVILANGLTLSDAHKLERYLQERIWALPKNDKLYRKYHPEKSGKGVYYPSAGPASVDMGEHGHSVYIAWYEKDER